MTHPASQATQTDSLSKLKARVERNPQDGAAWLAIAQILARTRSGPELSLAISKSIELLPDEYPAWLLAALDMQHSRGTAAALQWLHLIAQQRPGLAAPRLARAQLQTTGQPEAATQDFLSILQDFPEDARAHLLYAEHLQNLGQLNAAGNHLEMALAIKPEVVQNWEALAMIRLAEGQYDAAVVAANRALDMDDQARGARMSRAEAYRQAAQWQPAMEDYRELLKFMPENPYVLLGFGACLAGKGEFATALIQLGKALRIKPDFKEATLNIALVLASQGQVSEALHHLTILLKQNHIPDSLRNQALITEAVLQEQERLAPILDKAVKTHNLDGLQDALDLAPEILLQTDQRTEDSLRAMALASQQIELKLPVMEVLLTPQQTAFVEACLLSRAADNAADMIRLWQTQHQPGFDGRVFDATQQDLQNVWNVVMDRQRLCSLQINQGNGEALLRYWHFRMFERSAGYLPGLFKFAPNSIGLHQTTAPQKVIRTVKFLLDEIYFSLPAGLNRAAFILSAINRVHAFVDGNGRMARFLFGWDLEYAGLSSIQWTPDLRKTLAHCLDEAQYDNNFGAYQEGLQRAQKTTETLFRDFAERLDQI